MRGAGGGRERKSAEREEVVPNGRGDDRVEGGGYFTKRDKSHMTVGNEEGMRCPLLYVTEKLRCSTESPQGRKKDIETEVDQDGGRPARTKHLSDK